jgi:hypothetical protein
VRFTDAGGMELSVSSQLEFSESSSGESFTSPTDVTIEVLEYDPCIDESNAPDLFFTAEEIITMRSEARRQAKRFASDYPDYGATLEQLYNDNGTTDWESVKKTLRTRRKRKHAMKIASKWSLLDDDGDIDREDDYCFDEDTKEEESNQDDIYANLKESEEIDEFFCHADMRGLEFRITPMFRMHRKQAIDAILQLQKDMKFAGCCPLQIEMGLRAKAVQFSSRTKQFAVNQAVLDNSEVGM